jgi:hypothetical protein
MELVAVLAHALDGSGGAVVVLGGLMDAAVMDTRSGSPAGDAYGVSWEVQS